MGLNQVTQVELLLVASQGSRENLTENFHTWPVKAEDKGQFRHHGAYSARVQTKQQVFAEKTTCGCQSATLVIETKVKKLALICILPETITSKVGIEWVQHPRMYWFLKMIPTQLS